MRTSGQTAVEIECLDKGAPVPADYNLMACDVDWLPHEGLDRG
jgi:hypothetical protein